MARPKNPQRKGELLAQIIDYLQDKPLSALTFRTAADALGISAYVIVYHFGTREQLIHEIVSTVGTRADELKREDVEAWSRDQYEAWINEGWHWVVHERSRPLRRLGLEAAMQDLVSANPISTAQQYFSHWLEHTCTWLTAQGVNPDDAAAVARMLCACFYGLSYDLLINDDTDASTAAFEVMMCSFWRTLDERLGH
jgi:AcrR family transcriptional regulator